MNKGACSKKVILAYSGGLDTSVAVKWFMEKGYEVVCYMADVGQGADVEDSRKRALEIGASKCVVEDLTEEFLIDYAFRALKTGALYQGKYNLATALSRPLIAYAMLKLAESENATSVAHGCTGKGNDQVRFEATFHLKRPGIEILAPVREWELTTRESEIDYALKHEIPIRQSRENIYSIDCNLWGVSIEGGALEEISSRPGKDTFISVKTLEEACETPEFVTIDFEKGIPVGVNGKKKPPVELVRTLNEIGGKHGIGRVDMVEDRLVGIKSREIYECPGSTLLYEAINSLEELVLDREMRKLKRGLADRYAELVYNGLWFTPVKEAIDSFVDKACEKVTGEVELELYKGSAFTVKRESPFSRYDHDMATYGEGDLFDQSLARGFIELWALPYREKR